MISFVQSLRVLFRGTFLGFSAHYFRLGDSIWITGEGGSNFKSSVRLIENAAPSEFLIY